MSGGARRGSRTAASGLPATWSPADLSPDADPESVARAICLRLLTAAPRTRAQLAEALRRRAVPDEAAERVLDRLGEVGLIDDAAFAESWVQSRHLGRGLARRALSHELRQRGIDPVVAAQAVQLVEPEAELATARALVARRLPSTRGLPPAVRARRLAGLLARKGYPRGLAAQVVREALADVGPGDLQDDLEGDLGADRHPGADDEPAGGAM